MKGIWIAIDEQLPDHPKTIAAAHLLGIDPDMFIGKLMRLWSWALHFRPNGFFSEYEISTIAEKMRWNKPVKKLMDALLHIPDGYQFGFLERVEGGYKLHDWEDYSGSFSEKKRKDRERKSSGNMKESAENSDGFPSENTRKDNRNSGEVPDNFPQNSAPKNKIKNKSKIKRDIKGFSSSRCYTRACACESTAREGTELSETDRQVQKISEYYQSNGGVANTAVLDSIRYFLGRGMETETILEAVRRGALGNKRWRYIESILESWDSAGLRTVAQVQAENAWAERKPGQTPERKKTFAELAAEMGENNDPYRDSAAYGSASDSLSPVLCGEE